MGTKRLVITKLVLENFKSYEGIQEVGPFHKCFSSVVGPNGSGKSNVIDAMLFVFGKRAKQLRLNKVSELINNSGNLKNIQYAQVSVHFVELDDQGGEEANAIPGTELVVSRAAYRDNTSKYLINGASSTYTEVTKLLKQKGIDLDNNRFLILQGEVEQIAMMKPKGQDKNDVGLLEYLEDIIGSNQFVTDIEEAHKSLEELNERRAGMIARVKHTEKEKDSLEVAKKEAESYVIHEGLLLRLRQRQCHLIETDLGLKVSQAEAKMQGLRAAHSQDLLACSEQDKLLEATKASAEAHRAGQEEASERSQKVEEKWRAHERRRVKQEEDNKHHELRLKKLKDKIKKDEAKLKELETEKEAALVSIPKLEKKKEDDVGSLAEAEAKLETLQEAANATIQSYREELSSLHKELDPWDQKISDCQARIKVAKSEAALLRDKHAAAKQNRSAAASLLAECEQRFSKKTEEVQSLEQASQKHQADAAAGQEQHKTAVEAEAALEAQLQQSASRLSDMSSNREAESSRNGVIRAIYQARDRGEIRGIYGRLGDLGAIDAKYDIAVSTACGALDNIVVESTEAAQECISLLRSRNLGIATFLILDKQQQWLAQSLQSVAAPEGVHRLFDLVRIQDEKLRPAFFFALQNTVVAQDLDQATRIAYGPDHRFRRVVTLEGALLESSGTMAGGGGKPRGGKMGSAVVETVDPQVLKELEEEVGLLKAQLEAVRNQVEAASKQIAQANKALNNINEVQKPRLQLELQALQSQMVDTQRRLVDLETAEIPTAADVDCLKALDVTISEQESHLSEFQQASASLRKQGAKLQKEINEAGGPTLRAQKEAAETLRQEADSLESEISRLKVKAATNEQQLKKLKVALEQNIATLASLQEEQQQLKGVLQDILTAAEGLTSERQDCEKEAKSLKEIEQQLLEKVRQQEASRDQCYVAKMQAEASLKELESQGHALQAQLREIVKAAQEHTDTLNGLENKFGVEGSFTQSVDELVAQRNMGDLPLHEVEDNIADVEGVLKAKDVNLSAISEFRERETEYRGRVLELEELSQQRDEVRRGYEDLRRKRLELFMAGFNAITVKLKEMYQMVTLGGDAELELVDSLDPFSEGVVFSVRPPKKSWKNISNLSGGEKTLSSLALVFALHHYKPTPLYVMDEIDAALDFKNVSIVAHYIKDRTKNAQFIIISLRNNMFELADRLVGVYKTDNCTKSITINPRSFAIATSS